MRCKCGEKLKPFQHDLCSHCVGERNKVEYYNSNGYTSREDDKRDLNQWLNDLTGGTVSNSQTDWD